MNQLTIRGFGLFAAQLRRRGTPIPTNDVWIAAHAMETGGHLLSFDRHFEAVDGLLWSHLDGEWQRFPAPMSSATWQTAGPVEFTGDRTSYCSSVTATCPRFWLPET